MKNDNELGLRAGLMFCAERRDYSTRSMLRTRRLTDSVVTP